MAITFVAATSASAGTLTLPTHQAGDLLLMAYYRHDSATPAAVPAGWYTKFQNGSSTNSIGIAWKVATSSAETSGTWTNATQLACASYRSDAGCYVLPGAGAQNNGAAAANINYASVGAATAATTVNFALNVDAWMVGVCGTRTDDAGPTAPTGMTNRTSTLSTGELALHDSNGPDSTWGSTNVATTSVDYRTQVLEIWESPIAIPSGGGLIGAGNLSGGFQ